MQPEFPTPEFPTKDAIAHLNQALRLPATGREQDWDIELADPGRAEEFVAYAETHDLPPEQRLALMSLILGSLEDLSQAGGLQPALWARAQSLLDADRGLYGGLVKRWAGGNGDGFSISPLLRVGMRAGRA